MKVGLILLYDKSNEAFLNSSKKILEILDCNFSLREEHVFVGDWDDYATLSDYYEDIVEHIKVCCNDNLSDIIVWYIGHGIHCTYKELYVSLNGTPVLEPKPYSDFCFSSLMERIEEQKINKWIFLDCCHSAVIKTALESAKNTIVLCASGKDVGRKIRIEGSFTRLTNGFNELFSSPVIKTLSLNNVVTALLGTEAFKGKMPPHIIDRSDEKLADKEFFNRSLMQYPGRYFSSTGKSIGGDLFLNLCSNSAHALIISHRTGSIHWNNLQKTTASLSEQLRKYCTNPKFFKDRFKNLHGIPPLLIYVLEYPGDISDENGAMKAIYNFTMLKTIFQTILMSAPNSNAKLSLLTPEIEEIINVEEFADNFDHPDLYNELKLWHWFSYRCCFVVQGFKRRSQIFINMTNTLKTLGFTEHILKHQPSNEILSSKVLKWNVHPRSILETQIPHGLSEESFADTTNLKENLTLNGNDNGNSGFGLYSTVHIEDVKNPRDGFVDFWKWSIVNEKDELSTYDPQDNKMKLGAKLVWLGALHKLLFCAQGREHNSALSYFFDNDNYETLIQASIEARAKLDALGFSVLNVAEFLAEPSFNSKFPTGVIK